jgi:hypothetical protein
MYVIMAYISFGIIEQQVQVCLIENSSLKVVEFTYATINELGQTFKELADVYNTEYIKLPLNPDIEEELVKNYGFKIFKEEQENE